MLQYGWRRWVWLICLAAAAVWLDQAVVIGDGCDTQDYQEACWEAQIAADLACDRQCEREFGVSGFESGTGTCHWVGEDNPGECEENHPDDCGCFDGYDGYFCYCLLP